MNGKFYTRVAGLCFFVLFFLGAFFVTAGGNFKMSLFSLFKIEHDSLSTQEASVLGAFNTNDWIVVNDGVASVDSNNTRIDILTPEDDGGLCFGNCEQESAVGSSTVVATVEESIQEANVSDVTTSSSTPVTTETKLLAEFVTSTSSDAGSDDTEDGEVQVSSSTELTFETSETDGDDSQQQNESQNSGDKNRGSTYVAQQNTESGLDVSTTTSGIEPEDELSEIDMFVQKLSQILNIGDENKNIGIGMQPLANFALSIYGWLFVSKGIIVGDETNQVGLGVTEQGICLGACDFDIVNNSLVGAGLDSSASSTQTVAEETNTLASTSILSEVIDVEQTNTSTSSSSTLQGGETSATTSSSTISHEIVSADPIATTTVSQETSTSTEPSNVSSSTDTNLESIVDANASTIGDSSTSTPSSIAP